MVKEVKLMVKLNTIKHPSWDVKGRANWRMMVKLVAEHWERQEEIRIQQAAKKAWVEAVKKRMAKKRAERAERAERQERDYVVLPLQGCSICSRSVS